MHTSTWKLHNDGSSSDDGSHASIVLTPPDGGEPLRYALVLTFKVINNEAEYEASITGLQKANRIGSASLRVYCDSQLVINKVNDEYMTKGEKMKKYLRKAKSLA